MISLCLPTANLCLLHRDDRLATTEKVHPKETIHKGPSR